MKTLRKILQEISEEAPMNSVGSGNIAGAGVGPQGEPGVSPNNRYKRKNKKESPVMDVLRRLRESWEEHHGNKENITKMLNRSHIPDTQESIALWGTSQHHDHLIMKHGEKLTPQTKQTIALHGNDDSRRKLVQMKKLDHGTKQLLAMMGPHSVRDALLSLHGKDLDHGTKNLLADYGNASQQDRLRYDHELDGKTNNTLGFRDKYPREEQPRDLKEEYTGKFAGRVTHKVPRHVFSKIVHEKAKGKHWKKYLGDDETTLRIREYAMRNPKKPIIIEDEATGYMCFAKYGA
jgi:hypothetical protein